MIEFYGERSGECKLERHKRVKKDLKKFFIPVIVLGPILAIVLGIAKNSISYAVIMSLLIVIPYTLILVMPMTKAAFNFGILTRVTIEKDRVTLIAYQGMEVKKVKPIVKIKKVIDVGEWYYLVFGDITTAFVCEKKLLTKGTLEEFEKIFEGKIIKKN